MDSNVLRPAQIPENGDGYLPHHSSHGRIIQIDSNRFKRIFVLNGFDWIQTDSNVLRAAEIPENGDGYIFHHSSHGRILIQMDLN